MIKPPCLKPGATIGIVNPSYWLEEALLTKGAVLFKKKGYQLKMGLTTQVKDHIFAGTPAQRAEDLLNFFQDETIDAIICGRGGYGANRVLPLLDYNLIQSHPKIFMGYSDITALLTSITQKTGLVTFHGPMLVTFKRGMVRYNFDLLEQILQGTFPVSITPPLSHPASVLKAGIAEGPLWGGNATLLSNRLATPDQLKTNNAILFLEDVDEYLYSFDRLLYHFRQTGMFDHIRGLIIGELVEMKDQKIPFGKTTDEIVLDVCGDLDIPIVTHFPCGHGRYQATLPLSIPVRLDAEKGHVSLDLLESPVVC